MRKLTLELNDKTPSQAKKSVCALTYQRPCCSGRGYTLKTHGPHLRASLCECIFACPLCEGHTQVVDQDYARHCQNPSPRRVVNLLNGAAIPARYLDATLNRFSNLTGNMRARLQEVHAWLAHFSPGKSPGLLLSGPVGVGKTYLLCCIAKDLASKGHGVKFVDFFQLLSQIRAGYAEKKSDQAILQPLIDVDVLIIDEMGKGRNTEFELVILDQLVMGRYNQNKPLVASTNCHLGPSKSIHSLEDVPLDSPSHDDRNLFASMDYGSLESRVGERIYSRLMETTKVIELKGDDFRRRSGN